MNLKDIMDEYYDKQPKPTHFRNGPLNDWVSGHLEKMGAIGSVSWTENGKVVTEYIYQEEKSP